MLKLASSFIVDLIGRVPRENGAVSYCGHGTSSQPELACCIESGAFI